MNVEARRPYQNQAVMQKANTAIARERKARRMYRADNYQCVVCGCAAQDYHHQSYQEDDRLCVIPVCKKCHTRIHKCGLELPPLGIVPTGVGLVRIAIAANGHKAQRSAATGCSMSQSEAIDELLDIARRWEQMKQLQRA